MEFVGEGFAIVAALAALAGARGVAALQNKVLDEAVEDGVVVVAIEAELQEVARRDGRLFREELELKVAGGCVKNHLRRWRRFEIVRGGHAQVVCDRCALSCS